MSVMAGTSWGTLATVGIACMGVAQGLGVPLPAAAGAVCVGAFFGDKVSPLSDSPVITATVSEVPLMEGIKHALISTGPAYLISLVFFLIYGLRFGDGTVGGEVYDDILSTVSSTFSLNPALLLPVLVVIVLIVMKKPTLPTFVAGIAAVLIVMKKPTLPTFVAGIAAGGVLAMVFQGATLTDVMNVMYSGYAGQSGSEVVDSMLNRGGFTSMLSTIGLLMAAGIFGAPLRTAGVVDVLLEFVKKIAKTSRSMALGVLILHTLFFTITGAYYVSYPVVGGMVKDLFPEYGLEKKNLMRIMLDTGTGFAPLVPWSTTGSYTATTLGVSNMADLFPEYGLEKKNLMRIMLDTGTGFAPLVPWSTTGSYTATTLGVSNMAFLPFAPMLWLSIVFSVIYAVTGIGMAKLSGRKAENR